MYYEIHADGFNREVLAFLRDGRDAFSNEPP